jgi:hypothetical protein
MFVFADCDALEVDDARSLTVHHAPVLQSAMRAHAQIQIVDTRRPPRGSW